MGTIKDLIAYQKAFKVAMEVFHLSKGFPKEETYSLTDQIRRSSRAVNANLAEAYKKRRYPNHFISKLSDADMENSETQTWLDFAKECKYINQETYDNLFSQTEEVAKLLNYMMNNHEKFLIKRNS
ncbi:MAG: four helix bundle protein [Bacteroidetes bacterium]|nr:four helix bundle protein [Bacteroidota bacterium]MBU1373065.1 four helix bundle protein [Bacteroidota bacterium]MBU1484246.1 four helix bundle protein [Bacteroidota bacterium]MBU1761774.1 four helix bundle protein [Bacteroidota bacterium]MBU2046486.1 four helix bundle protein [Bacteroidota bacterium]